MREEAPGHAGLPLHGAEVALAVAPPEREAGDEVMEDEVVEHDDARALAQRLDDPAVRVGVVADVVEADVGVARRRLPARHDRDVEPLAQRREQELAVLRYSRPLGRKRREVRDLHASSRSIA